MSRHWMLQWNPNRWFLPKYLADGHTLDSWTVRQHLSDMADGDQVALWRSGAASGVVALGRLTGSAEPRATDVTDDQYWAEGFAPEPGAAYAVPLVLTELFLNDPIPRERLAADPAFAEALILRAPFGKNPFPLTAREWDALTDAAASVESSPAPADWDLLPGTQIRRVDLHAQYGGSGQGGIASSSRSPNIFLFTDPRTGLGYGYHDEWSTDGAFLYTGEGQQGDQQFVRNNKSVRDHQADGKSLRLILGSRGVVEYVGEFALDPADPWSIMRSHQRGTEGLRDVIRFRLLPIAEQGRSRPTITVGTTYRTGDETSPVQPAQYAATQRDPDSAGRGLRMHMQLQNQLAVSVANQGLQPLSPTATDPDFDLAWDDGRGKYAVVEVKSTHTLNETRQLRLGLGQALDYADTLSRPDRDVSPILYVARPPADLRWVDLAQRAGVLLRWPGFHDSIPGL